MSNENINTEINEKDDKPNRGYFGKIMLTVFMLILFILIILLGTASWQLFRMQEALHGDLQELTGIYHAQKNEFAKAQEDILALQQFAKETNDVKAQQEKILADIQGGNLAKWYLTEALYLVNLANDQVQFTHNLPMALLLLQRAEAVLQNVSDPQLLELRKALAENMTSLQAQPVIDIATLYAKLTAIDKQLDQLPLQSNLAEQKNTNETLDANASIWRKAYHQTVNALQKIVLVRRDTNKVMPFMMPDEKSFLLQNLRAQMQLAELALVNRNAVIYQLSLHQVLDWVRQYFDNNAKETQVTLQNLEELAKINIAPPTINFADTLKLFQTINQKNTEVTTTVTNASATPANPVASDATKQQSTSTH